MSFIRPIIARIKENSINDEEIKKAFESYTLLHLDLALHSDEGQKPSMLKGATDEAYKIEDLTHENEKLWDILFHRINRFKKTNYFKIQKYLSFFKEFDLKSNLRLSDVERQLRKLRLSKEVSDKEAL